LAAAGQEASVQIAVLTFDGFNELDSFVAAAILNRMKAKGWAAHITCPTPEARICALAEAGMNPASPNLRRTTGRRCGQKSRRRMAGD
jgi:hypothetical protein